MSEWRRTCLASIRCFLRGLPLFFCAAPRTPLRVLGIIAFDTLHLLRHSRPLSQRKIADLAWFLDFEGFANARWDQKSPSEVEYQAIRRRLETCGYRVWIDTYLGRLRDLERERPPVGSAARSFTEVRAYREGVARLALTTAAAIALNPEGRDEQVLAAQGDRDIETLVRILMQCQILDDVLDYARDVSAGLPTFLTGSDSLPQALDQTVEAAHDYGAISARERTRVLPFHITLSLLTWTTTAVLRLTHQRLWLSRQVAHR